mmetsp:Transcript_485/g.1454  ORF Transcript_485/g.1454 Transcript_485/m.1454 type:complete len:828 (+) Transcript_485:37-2520(+)
MAVGFDSLLDTQSTVLGIELTNSDGLAPKYSALADDTGVPLEEREAAMQMALAEAYFDAGQSETAAKLATEAQTAFQAASIEVAAADALRLMIHCFRQQDKLDFASLSAAEELERFRAHSDASGEGKMLLCLAETSMCRGGHPSKTALVQAADALETFDGLTDIRMRAVTLLTLANLHLRCKEGTMKERSDQAKSKARAAADAFRHLEDQMGEARSLHSLSVACRLARDFDEASSTGQRALALFRQLGNRRLEAAELNSLALAKLARGDAQEALLHAEQALSTFRELGCGSCEAAALGTVARAYAEQQQAEQALQTVREGMHQLRMAGDAGGEARALDALIYANLANNNTKAALRAAERAQATFCKMKSSEGRWKESAMLREISRLHLRLWNLDKAQEAAEEALKLGKALESELEQGKALLQLATARESAEKYDAAMTAAEDARALFASAGDGEGEAEALRAAASICFRRLDYEQAGSLANRAHVLSCTIRDEAGDARAMSMLGRVQIARKQFGAAAKAADMAHGICSNLGDKAMEVSVLLQAAEASLMRARDGGPDAPGHEEAKLASLEAAGEAVSICREDEARHREALAQGLFWLAQAELLDGRPEEALADAEEALSSFRSLSDPLSQAAVLEIVSRAHADLGEQEPAFEALSDAHALCSGCGHEEGEKHFAGLLRQLEGEATSLRVAALVQQLQSGAGNLDEATLTSLVRQLGGSRMGEIEDIPSASVDPTVPKIPKALAKLDTSGGVNTDLVIARVREALEEMGVEEIEVDSGLMQSGLTSSNVIMLRNLLSTDFPAVPLPATLAFDYPTLGSLAGYIVDKIP